jgi:hypothetical protein
MSKRINDGGPAFPCPTGTDGGALYNGMSLRQWYATHAPQPTEGDIDVQRKYDRNRNPHNDSYKPPLRSRIEIIADLAFEYADAMIKAGSKL